MKIAVLGPRGSFSEEAALERYGQNIKLLYGRNLSEVAKLVATGKAEHGLIPFETSEGGVNPQAVKALASYPVYITTSSLFNPIFYLLAKEDESKLRIVRSHQQGLIAANKFLDEKFPYLVRRETSSTSKAAYLASKNPTVGAITSQRAAEIYGLNILHTIPSEHKELPNPKARIIVYNRKTETVEEVVNLPGVEFVVEAFDRIFRRLKGES